MLTIIESIDVSQTNTINELGKYFFLLWCDTDMGHGFIRFIFWDFISELISSSS